MERGNIPIRPLNAIEQAFTISNEAHPLCVVCVLHLSSGPDAAVLTNALEQLQSRHQLLQAGIVKMKGRYFFHRLSPARPIPLQMIRRLDADTWRTAAEDLLNTQFDTSGPLMKCSYLPDSGDGNSELLLCFHHAIIDGTSARLILHELLSLSGGVSLHEPTPSPGLRKFPPAYRNMGFARLLFGFMGRQLEGNVRYKIAGMTSAIPVHSKNAILSFRLSPEISRKLSVRAGREGLSMNSVLLAALTNAVIRHKHGGKAMRLARVVSFAELRGAVIPPVSDQELGCYISMLRFEVPISQTQSISELAAYIRKALFRAGRRGEIFIMFKIARYLIRMVLRLRNQRLGISALSYIEKLDLDPQYGSIRLHNVMAFITNNRFGPGLSSFGKILFGSIGLDITYLTSETDASEAEQMMDEVRETLERFANMP